MRKVILIVLINALIITVSCAQGLLTPFNKEKKVYNFLTHTHNNSFETPFKKNKIRKQSKPIIFHKTEKDNFLPIKYKLTELEKTEYVKKKSCSKYKNVAFLQRRSSLINRVYHKRKTTSFCYPISSKINFILGGAYASVDISNELHLRVVTGVVMKL